MTIDEVEKLPIEKIIFLPEFKSVERFDGMENARFGGPIVQPYWEVKFNTKQMAKSQNYECFGKIVNHRTMVMRFPISPMINELIMTGQLSS